MPTTEAASSARHGVQLLHRCVVLGDGRRRWRAGLCQPAHASAGLRMQEPAGRPELACAPLQELEAYLLHAAWEGGVPRPEGGPRDLQPLHTDRVRPAWVNYIERAVIGVMYNACMTCMKWPGCR